MTVTARWPHPNRWAVAFVALLVLVSVWFDQTALAVFVTSAGFVWVADKTRVTLNGGGFRPLRTVDLIEFSSADQLDAYDREQASKR